MTCYHPLKAFRNGTHPSGKPKYKITGMGTQFITVDGNVVDESIQIPCGKCIGCRLAYSREWANRMLLEAKYHDESWFVTLTYDDKHLPSSYYMPDEETGELIHSPIHTLDKKDPQLFMKRLRKNSGQDLRVYYVGEYGDQNHRPHYHMIIFGLHLTDIYSIKKNKKGNDLYYSHLLDKCWKKGIINASEFNWDTAAYVARYVTKKLKGPSGRKIYDYFNIEPPFARMSNRPGIGHQYYEDNADYFYKYDQIAIETAKRGYTFKPP